MRSFASLLFVAGLAFLLLILTGAFEFGNPPMRIGQAIQAVGAEQTGAANLVTAVVLGYRGIDTLGELSILFAAATAGGFVLGRHRANPKGSESGFVLRTGADLLFRHRHGEDHPGHIPLEVLQRAIARVDCFLPFLVTQVAHHPGEEDVVGLGEPGRRLPQLVLPEGVAVLLIDVDAVEIEVAQLQPGVDGQPAHVVFHLVGQRLGALVGREADGE